MNNWETYFKSISPSRIKLSSVPSEYIEHIKVYKANYDYNALPIIAHNNAMLAVRRYFSKPSKVKAGNCPRCSGKGIIQAYTHIKGGVCLKCSGTGNI